jgi:hypothetical protein
MEIFLLGPYILSAPCHETLSIYILFQMVRENTISVPDKTTFKLWKWMLNFVLFQNIKRTLVINLATGTER